MAASKMGKGTDPYTGLNHKNSVGLVVFYVLPLL